MNRSVIANLETCRRGVSALELARLAKAYRCPIETLLRGLA